MTAPRYDLPEFGSLDDRDDAIYRAPLPFSDWLARVTDQPMWRGPVQESIPEAWSRGMEDDLAEYRDGDGLYDVSMDDVDE